MLKKTTSFVAENGIYVLVSTALGLPSALVRNWLLAQKLGVKKLRIGPHPHIRGLAHIQMGEDFMAGREFWLEAVTHFAGESFNPKIQIGSHVRISNWSHIACTHSVIIGDHVLIGSKVIITDHNHGSFGIDATSPDMPPDQRPLDRNRSVKLGRNVWLGDGVVVCPGVTMEEGSVAGANSVVTTDVPPFTLVAGSPARIIRRYDRQLKKWARV